MKLILLNDEQKKYYKEELYDILEESNNDFIPPLSKRRTTTDKDLSGNNNVINGIFAYLENLISQSILGVFIEDELIGFVSYIENFTNEIIEKKYLPNIYVSTLLVKKSMRGKNVCSITYEHLFNKLYKNFHVFTRTWSTNLAHIKILKKFEFNEFLRIKNDRSNNIDTIYFAKLK